MTNLKSKEWNGNDPLDKVQHLLSVMSVWIQENFGNWFEWTKLTAHWCIGAVGWMFLFCGTFWSRGKEISYTNKSIFFFLADILKCLNSLCVYISYTEQTDIWWTIVWFFSSRSCVFLGGSILKEFTNQNSRCNKTCTMDTNHKYLQIAQPPFLSHRLPVCERKRQTLIR